MSESRLLTIVVQTEGSFDDAGADFEAQHIVLFRTRATVVGAEWGDALAERDDLRRQYASVTDELTAAYLGANEFVSNVKVTRFPPAPITEDEAR